jgi:hypothetical protein
LLLFFLQVFHLTTGIEHLTTVMLSFLRISIRLVAMNSSACFWQRVFLKRDDEELVSVQVACEVGVPKGYKGRRPLPSELYFCGRCQRYHLYESQIGEEHAIFRADELRPRTKEDYLLRRLRPRPSTT